MSILSAVTTENLVPGAVHKRHIQWAYISCEYQHILDRLVSSLSFTARLLWAIYLLKKIPCLHYLGYCASLLLLEWLSCLWGVAIWKVCTCCISLCFKVPTSWRCLCGGWPTIAWQTVWRYTDLVSTWTLDALFAREVLKTGVICLSDAQSWKR